MKPSLLRNFLTLFFCAASLVSAQNPPTPTQWTNTAGVTIPVDFVKLDGNAVVILKDGKELKIPLANLSLASREQARKLAGGAITPAPATAESSPGALPAHAAIPQEGAWKTGPATGFPKPGYDRLFLVNRGWVEGKLLAADASSVTMQVVADTLRLPRNQVSLIGLADYLDPNKGTADKVVRLRIVMAGAAECATLHFNNGAVIKQVEKEPVWEEGGDADDKAFTSPTTISFEKGNADISVTRLTCEISLLLPPGGPLACQINNNRANGYSGALAVKFIELASGREIATLDPPKDKQWRMWCRFEIPLEKFLKPANTLKLEPLPAKFESAKVPTLGLLTAQASRPALGTAHLIFVGEPARTVLIERIDATTIRLNDPQHTSIPRNRLAWIELLDWQVAMQAAALAKNPAVAGTPPLRFISFGVSTQNSVTLQEGALFARLIVPPYPLFGMDRGDTFAVKDERSLQCQKGDMDQSPYHAEVVATLSLPPDSTVNLDFANAYTNVWSGSLEVVIKQVLTGRRVAEFKSAEGELKASRKVQRSKLMTP